MAKSKSTVPAPTTYSELHHCPICDGKDLSMTVRREGTYVVECTCGSRGPASATEEAAAEAWNAGRSHLEVLRFDRSERLSESPGALICILANLIATLDDMDLSEHMSRYDLRKIEGTIGAARILSENLASRL